MKSFVVIGLGRFGSALARELYKLGNEVLAIDTNPENVQKISSLVTHSVVADAKDEGVLKSLGVRNFDCAVVSIGSIIENSVLVTLILKDLGVKYVVAKGQSQLHTKVLEKIGADKVIFPEHDMGQRLAQTLTSSNVIDFIELSEEYSIVEVGSPHGWIGKSILDLNVRARYGLNILAVRGCGEKDVTVSPSANYVISERDTLIVIGANDDITKITQH